MRPLALSPNGKRLFAVNTPDGTLEILHVGVKGLAHVAVAVRTNGEVWVVNHLSDSVSIVDVRATPPRDIVFADPDGFGVPRKAFITAAHRGQNGPVDPPRALAMSPDRRTVALLPQCGPASES